MRIRPTTPDDEPAILRLLESSLGWLVDEDHARFYRWKHVENPFGPSPGWVAEDDGRVVGLRLFMRWEFRRGAEVIRAVRAVDTATHADYRGQGIFRKLTLHALEGLQQEGVAFVFNTPNDQSRPGYLKMGWRVVGRLPARLRPRSPAVLGRVARARVPADLSSLPTDAGRPAAELLADAEVGRLLDDVGRSADTRGLTTDRTAAYLRWRYGHEPLAYRAVAPTGEPSEGLVIFRLRRRGPATEAVLADVVGGLGRRHGRRARKVLWQAGADHLIALGATSGIAAVPVPRLGPVLTSRTLTAPAPEALEGWRLSMGDIELM